MSISALIEITYREANVILDLLLKDLFVEMERVLPNCLRPKLMLPRLKVHNCFHEARA